MAFSLAPLLLLLVGAELAVRVVGVPSAVQARSGLGWTAQPGVEGAEYCTGFGQAICFEVSTNADGLRTTVPRERRPGVRRAMVFGESTIFGWGVGDEETPAAALSRRLGEGWEVVNAGQPGYSSEQVARLALSAVPAYRPDVVVWFQPWNDTQYADEPDHEILPEHQAELRGRPWWARSHLLLALRTVQGPAELEAGINPMFAFQPLGSPTPGSVGTTMRVPADRRHDNLARTKALVEREGGRLVVSLLPRGLDRRSPGQPPHPLEEALASSCETLGLPFVNLATVTHDWPDLEATLEGDPGHFTWAANKAFALALVGAVREAAAELPAP